MALQALDAEAFPVQAWHQSGQGRIQLGQVVGEMTPLLQMWMNTGVVKQNKSFGFGMAATQLWTPERGIAGYQDVWDDPRQLVGLVVYWGPKGLQYAGNVARKMRAAAREGQDTLRLANNNSELFRDKVESVEDDGTTMMWGDFPHGGARFINAGGRTLLGGVSCYSPEEDHEVAGACLNVIGATMALADAKSS